MPAFFIALVLDQIVLLKLKHPQARHKLQAAQNDFSFLRPLRNHVVFSRCRKTWGAVFFKNMILQCMKILGIRFLETFWRFAKCRLFIWKIFDFAVFQEKVFVQEISKVFGVSVSESLWYVVRGINLVHLNRHRGKRKCHLFVKPVFALPLFKSSGD